MSSQSGILDVAFISASQIRRNAQSQAFKILKENEKGIINLNTQGQLFLGVDSNGNRLKPYTPYTIAIKKEKGQPSDRTTLKDTGSFYSDFFLFSNGKDFDLFSSNIKTEKLTEKYGKDIFGLTPDNEHFVNFEIVLPHLIEWMISQLRL